MDIFDQLSHLTPLDFAAVAILFCAWLGIGWRIEHPNKNKPSVSILMGNYRREWMRQFVERTPRIYDSQILATLRQGTSFFASTCILAIGGVIALIGNTERLSGVAEDFTISGQPEIIWELKLLIVALLLTNGFLKFVWANRLFGYCAVVMSATPNDPSDDMAFPRAAQAAELNIRAAVNFNRGLRSMYFALGALAWLLGPVSLLIATTLTLWILWQREFNSVPREILLNPAQK